MTGSIPAAWPGSTRSARLPLVEAATVGIIADLAGADVPSLVAPLVALVAAGLAYLVALGLIGWVGQAMEVSIPADVEPLVVVVLLGIVTDYAIFFLSGVRARSRPGDARLEAAERDGPGASGRRHRRPDRFARSAASLLAGRARVLPRIRAGPGSGGVRRAGGIDDLVPALLAVLGTGRFLALPPLRSGPTAMRLAREDEQNPVTLRAVPRGSPRTGRSLP